MLGAAEAGQSQIVFSWKGRKGISDVFLTADEVTLSNGLYKPLVLSRPGQESVMWASQTLENPKIPHISEALSQMT